MKVKYPLPKYYLRALNLCCIILVQITMQAVHMVNALLDEEDKLMKRFPSALFLALMLSLLIVPPAFAGDGHIYGVVFIDENKDGVWGDEPGVAEVPVHFISTGGETEFVLYSALNGNDGLEGPDMYCSHLREEHRWVPKGCNGTLGLVTIDGWWTVYIDVPEGYALNTPGGPDDPYYVRALFTQDTWDDGTEWLEFGLIPATASTRQVPAYTGNYVFRNRELQMAAMGVSISPFLVQPME